VTDWRFGPVSEADFEPLLAIRIEVMREHLERVFRYKPSRARRIFREHFDEPGLRLILISQETAGCVGFRVGETEIKIDSFYLSRRYHNRGLGTEVLKAPGRSRCAGAAHRARCIARQHGRPIL
jgi:hypothetical protein